MKKTYILEELDCANCAAKIEEGVAKVDGVDTCSVNFLTRKMVIEAADDKLDSVSKKIKKVIKKIDSDVEVIEK